MQPPSFRFDVAIEADLIEELARVRGYGRIPGRSPLGALKMNPRPERALDIARLRQVLCDRGYQEAITYSFVDPVNLERLMPGVETLRLANPIASDMSVMRPSLWPGLLGALKRNQDRQAARVRLFETGLVFRLVDGKLDQCPRIGGVAWGPCVPEQWAEPRRTLDFFDVKNDVEALLALAGADGGAVGFRPYAGAALRGLHPHQSAVVLRARERGGGDRRPPSLCRPRARPADPGVSLRARSRPSEPAGAARLPAAVQVPARAARPQPRGGRVTRPPGRCSSASPARRICLTPAKCCRRHGFSTSIAGRA